ncbi:hypothetical protein HPB50_024240 [Hyalomma asiaticum]|uniref:Uncharacterized protein n=1 Tax=Hyalomma asiaticum TaxID=266040 RepID=A0ACB7TLH5_HYAAI|nr:hypothetical protein HPB50_024240 [Hyalomma asiaticum]
MSPVKDFALVPSGILRVRMEMNCPVPNLLKVDGRFAQCEYEGVVRLCRRCNLAGHHADACTTPRCARCAEFGHAECDAACKRCGGDHAVSACRARTYSSVTARPTMAATEGKGSASAEAASTTTDTTGGEAEKPTAPPALPGAVEEAAEKGEGNSEQLFTLVTNKRSRRKRGLKTTRKPSPVPESSDSDSESGGSGGVPERKRTAVTESDEDSSATVVEGASSSGELKALCPMCGSSMCECSLLSDMSYPSTGDSPVKTEGPSVDS